MTQEIRVVEEYDKKRALYEVLEKVMDGSKVLIFTSTKRTADDLTASLRADGWPARAIHGDKSQAERDWVLAEFRSGKSPLMIATDVASRGLDVKDIRVTLNTHTHTLGTHRTRRCILCHSSILLSYVHQSVQTVINVDFPTQLEDYVHRVGAARAGQGSGVRR